MSGALGAARQNTSFECISKSSRNYNPILDVYSMNSYFHVCTSIYFFLHLKSLSPPSCSSLYNILTMYMYKKCQLTQTFSLISYERCNVQVNSFSWTAMIRWLAALSGNYVHKSPTCLKSEFLNQPHYVDLFLETSMTDCSTSKWLWIFYFPYIYIPAVKWQNSIFITDLLSFIGEVWYS